MSSEVAPLLIGFAAAGLLLVVIGIVLAARGLFERIQRPQRRSPESEGWATSQEWVYRPRVPREVRAAPPSPMSKAEASVGESSADGQGSLGEVDEARRETEVLLAAAERRCERLLRESEAEAERRAGEITEDARKHARELLEEAELEAKMIVADAGQERIRLLHEPARERALVDETRTGSPPFWPTFSRTTVPRTRERPDREHP